LNSLTGHTSTVLTAAFSPDNKVVVTGTRDGKATFWEVETGRRLRIIDNKTAVAHIAISPDGKRMVVSDDSEHREQSSDNRARLWNISVQATKPLDIQTAVYGSVSEIEFSPDGTLLALGTVNGNVLLYGDDRGLPRFQKRLYNNTNPIRKVVFSRQDARIAVLDEKKNLRMWDTESYRPLKVSGGLQGIVDDIAFGSTGTLLVSAIERDGKELTVFNAQSSRDDQKSELNLDFYPESWISAFSADATLLVITDKHRQWLRIYAQDADRMFEFAKRYVEMHRKLTDSECSLYFHDPTCAHLP
jgi:WD40 repeat protein